MLPGWVDWWGVGGRYLWVILITVLDAADYVVAVLA